MPLSLNASLEGAAELRANVRRAGTRDTQKLLQATVRPLSTALWSTCCTLHAHFRITHLASHCPTAATGPYELGLHVPGLICLGASLSVLICLRVFGLR